MPQPGSELATVTKMKTASISPRVSGRKRRMRRRRAFSASTSAALAAAGAAAGGAAGAACVGAAAVPDPLPEVGAAADGLGINGPRGALRIGQAQAEF